MNKIVLFLTFSVLCVVNTQSEDGCRHSRSYTRVKRGRYPGPPIRFYNRPPMTFPIKGVFSYTPPPFMQDDEPPYPGSRPYKDLDMILEFASGKDKYSYKGKDMDFEYSRPYKRENTQRPTYTKDIYKGNIDVKYQTEKPYDIEFKKYLNYVTEATPYALQDDRRNPYSKETESNQVSFYGPQNDGPPPFNTEQENALTPYRIDPQEERPTQYKGVGSQDSQSILYKPFVFQDQPTQFKKYGSQDESISPASIPSDSFTSQNFGHPQGSNGYASLSNVDIPETNEEEKLPPPTNMREEDFEVSYTNNVPMVVKADPDSDSYQVQSFGDLPLMNYNSKLHSVSSYHVPHYTVTQPKPQSLSSAPTSSFASSQSYASSTGLKESPAAASIKTPPFEPAPPVSAAKEQSDAHLKAIKIWSHKSKGAAYTLHDDGTLTPERPRPPKYGK